MVCVSIRAFKLRSIRLRYTWYVFRGKDTHSTAEARDQKNATMGKAMGINTEYQPGESFDQDMQAQRREERKAAYELRRAEREKEYKERVSCPFSTTGVLLLLAGSVNYVSTQKRVCQINTAEYVCFLA